MPWKQWTPKTKVSCSGTIAFDTETTEIEEGAVPIPILLTFSTGGGDNYVVAKDDIGVWSEMVSNISPNLVGHNFPFDAFVVSSVLTPPQRKKWRAFVSIGKAWDTMVLDFLIRLAEGEESGPLKLNGLAQCANEYLGKKVDKTLQNAWTPWVGKSVSEIPKMFIDYAVEDAATTYELYQEMLPIAVNISKHHGGGKPEWGPLTHHIQLKGAMSLYDATMRGIRVDTESKDDIEEKLKETIQKDVNWITEYYPVIFKKDKVKAREGQLIINKETGIPRLDNKELRKCLQSISVEKNIKRIPQTLKSREITISAGFWEKVDHPFIEHWVEMQSNAKLLSFLLQLEGDRVRPRYNTMVRTGRTSCAGPNLQQMPRVDWFRKLFIPSPGSMFVIADYNAVELRCLAAVCQHQWGFSALGAAFKRKQDPHALTASMMLGMQYDDFMLLKKKDPKKYNTRRQQAKAINFGVPGGLGPKGLSEYAKETYGVQMTVDEAGAFREKLTKEIYPELTLYLGQSLSQNMADNLSIELVDLVKCLDMEATSPGYFNVSLILSGKYKTNTAFSRHVWKCLSTLNKDPLLELPIRSMQGSANLHRQIMGASVTTLTGRVRGAVEYTEFCNTQFQGLAADGAKLALYSVSQYYPVVAFVHDELVVEVPALDAEECRDHIDTMMITAMDSVLQGYCTSEVESVVAPFWRKI